VDSLITAIKAATEAQTAEAYRFMEEQKIKKALAPVQWDVWKNELDQESQRMTARTVVPLQFGEDLEGVVTIRNLKSGSLATLWYDGDVPCIHYETPTIRGHIAFRVALDGTALQFMDNGVPKSASQLTEKIFKTVIK
jgi:hypothetical protein